MENSLETQAIHSEADVIANIVRGHIKPEIMTIKGQEGQTKTEVLILPKELQAHELKKFLDPYRTHPERREGTAVLTDLKSFIAHTRRFLDHDSALFANPNPDTPSLMTVLDYHSRVHFTDDKGNNQEDLEALPRFGQHRAKYNFPVSPEWQAWMAHQNQPMGQADFALFMEDRILDILPAPDLAAKKLTDADQRLKKMVGLLGGHFAGPEKMMDLSRGLRIHENAETANIVNTFSGEGEVVFRTEHSDETGEKLKVPNLFLIGIPVFKNGHNYRIACRLRFRKEGGAVVWSYDLYRADMAFDDALREACEQAANATKLPLFFGSPEA